MQQSHAEAKSSKLPRSEGVKAPCTKLGEVKKLAVVIQTYRKVSVVNQFGSDGISLLVCLS